MVCLAKIFQKRVWANLFATRNLFKSIIFKCFKIFKPVSSAILVKIIFKPYKPYNHGLFRIFVKPISSSIWAYFMMHALWLFKIIFKPICSPTVTVCRRLFQAYFKPRNCWFIKIISKPTASFIPIDYYILFSILY